MDLKQLQLVVELAEAGSFSKLCAQRRIVLSALSKQLASLETEFSAKLFHRTGRGVVLNDFGQSLLPRIQSLLNEARLLRDEVACRSALLPQGPVRLAMQASLTQSLVGELVCRLRRDHPLIDLRLTEGPSQAVEDALAGGLADIGVLARFGARGGDGGEVLGTDDLHLVAPARDAIAAASTFPFQRLAGLPLVLPRMPDGLRLALEDAAARCGIDLRVELEVDSVAAMKEIVAAGAGCTVLSRQAVTMELQTGRLQVSRLVEPALTRSLVLCTAGHRPLTPAAQTVVDLLRPLAQGGPATPAAGPVLVTA